MGRYREYNCAAERQRAYRASAKPRRRRDWRTSCAAFMVPPIRVSATTPPGWQRECSKMQGSRGTMSSTLKKNRGSDGNHQNNKNRQRGATHHLSRATVVPGRRRDCHRHPRSVGASLPHSEIHRALSYDKTLIHPSWVSLTWQGGSSGTDVESTISTPLSNWRAAYEAKQQAARDGLTRRR